jgi:hypothetical protein
MDITKILRSVAAILGGVAAAIAIMTFTVKKARKWRKNREKSRPIHIHVAGGSMEDETEEQREVRMIESDDPEIWKPQK